MIWIGKNILIEQLHAMHSHCISLNGGLCSNSQTATNQEIHNLETTTGEIVKCMRKEKGETRNYTVADLWNGGDCAKRHI